MMKYLYRLGGSAATTATVIAGGNRWGVCCNKFSAVHTRAAKGDKLDRWSVVVGDVR
jgi:hypothetical protein